MVNIIEKAGFAPLYGYVKWQITQFTPLFTVLLNCVHVCACMSMCVCMCLLIYVCVGTVDWEGSRGIFFETESGWGDKRKGKAGRGKSI